MRMEVEHKKGGSSVDEVYRFVADDGCAFYLGGAHLGKIIYNDTAHLPKGIIEEKYHSIL